MSKSSNPTADELFQMELAKRNLPFAIINDGLYKIRIGDVTATINLENIRRNYKRDNDADAIARFAGQLPRSIDPSLGRPTLAKILFLRYPRSA